MAATNTPIQLSYFIPDVSAVLGTYTKMRWWRSTSENGVYVPITADIAEIASLTVPDQTPYQLEGLTLDLDVTDNDVSHTFVATDPVDAATAAAELAAASVLIDCPTSGSSFSIDTATTGRASYVEIVGGDAAAMLGFNVGDAALGLDADTVLVSGTHEYFYTDPHSDTSYWYKVQFLDETAPVYSELSVAFSADQPDGVPKSNTLVCFIRLADGSGYPVVNRTIHFHNVPLPNKVSAVNGDWGIFRAAMSMTTDRNGYAEIRLLRGATFDMSIEGTGFVRRITIPTSGDAVDLLDATLVASDEFGIQVSTVTPAVRLS